MDVPLRELLELCRTAGSAVMEFYRRDLAYTVFHKGDASPITEADLKANAILLDGLQKLTPDLPIVSEETVPDFETRLSWNTYWLLDPLDGTREFIEGTDEFTVNVALIDAGHPVFGIVYAPVFDRAYSGGQGYPATRYDGEHRRSISCRRIGDSVTAAVSRRRATRGLQFVENPELIGGRDVLLKRAGSALKFCLVAEGRADIYPCLGPTSEWDSAAGHALIEAAGGSVFDLQGRTLDYGQRESLINPDFVAIGDRRFWSQIGQA